MSLDLVTEDTMPDDAWKDSFDKLLDQRPTLRELNVIKKDIRASFNMNSSYENSGYDNGRYIRLDCEQQTPQPNEFISTTAGSTHRNDPKSLGQGLSTQQLLLLQQQQNESIISTSSPPYLPLKKQYLNVPKNIKAKKHNKHRVNSDGVSTPIRDNITVNPFKCTLSPIGSWELRHFKFNDRKEYKKNNKKVEFNSTPVIENGIVNMEFIRDNNSNVENEKSAGYSQGISPFVLVRKKWKSKQSQKQVCFASNEQNENPKNLNQDVEVLVSHPLCPELQIQPGKWRKSLNCLRRTHNPVLENDKGRKSTKKQHQKGRSTCVVERPKFLTTTSCIAGNRKSVCIRSNSNEAGSRSTYSLGGNDFKRQLLQRCGQRRILTFSSTYSEDYLRNCCKIGEGAFGEVFVHSKPKEQHADNESAEKSVLKIIPIEGKELINGEVQKTFEQILPEVIISMELCGLSDDSRKTNVTSGFVNLQRARCIKGTYPHYLQKLWEDYDLEKESENDHPKCFTSNQQYIVLELAFSGQDLEGFQFKNAEQSFYALQQMILTLAVGESEYQFEHRDLHWGNVLILNTNRPNITYKLDDDVMNIPTKGVKITIIDYTLSRMTFKDYCFYNDLSNDEELFIATGDYQFEIYRMMRKVLNNKWETFEPKTNIFWISYIISKLIEGVSYKNIRSKTHLHYLEKLKHLQTSILTYTSCMDCARDVLLH